METVEGSETARSYGKGEMMRQNTGFLAGTLLCMKVQWWIRHYTFVTTHRIHLMKSEPRRYTMDSG